MRFAVTLVSWQTTFSVGLVLRAPQQAASLDSLLILCATSGRGGYSRRIPSRVMVALPRFKALACLAPFCHSQEATQDGFPEGSRSHLLASLALPSWIRGLCCITLLCHCAGTVCGLCLLAWNNVVDCLGICTCRKGEAVHAGDMRFTIAISRGGCTHSIKHPSYPMGLSCKLLSSFYSAVYVFLPASPIFIE